MPPDRRFGWHLDWTAIAIGIAATAIAVILHELAHGLVARAMGDPTAARAGRLTLNPWAHVDPFGTLFLPAFLALAQIATIGRVAFMFGWARPVPVSAQALHLGAWHDPRRLMALVALAGPCTNFALAFVAALGLRFGVAPRFCAYFLLVNLVLGLFNLIPFPPMDGGRIAVALLPRRAAAALAGFERQGILLLLLALFILPAALGQLGLRFNPLQSAFGVALPWAESLMLRLAGR